MIIVRHPNRCVRLIPLTGRPVTPQEQEAERKYCRRRRRHEIWDDIKFYGWIFLLITLASLAAQLWFYSICNNIH